ncbi:MAG: HAD hydrolase-like protein [Verrucomicrobiota bacterium]|nr:HAD hydrolase-like protein [Verrucomicrobiota bacterium]
MIGGIRHIIWDWNGTLLDDTAACVEALNRVLGRRGVPSVTREQYQEVFGFPVRDYYRAIGLTFTPGEWDALTREFHDHYAETSQNAPLREGIRETLEALRRQGAPMSVLSASETVILDRMLRARGIRDFFEHVCGLSDLNAHSKLEIGQKLMARLDLQPAEALLVGDTTHDWDVARALGCQCALLAGGHQAERRLRACGGEVIANATAFFRFLRVTRLNMRT